MTTPTHSSPRSAMGAALFAVGEIKEALYAAEQTVGLRGSARDWCNYAMLLRKAGDLKQAEQCLYRALTVDATYEKARTELAKLHEARTAGDEENYV